MAGRLRYIVEVETSYYGTLITHWPSRKEAIREVIRWEKKRIPFLSIRISKKTTWVEL